MAEQDYFISYNKNNEDWAEWIAGTLEANGYGVRLQAWDIAAGNNFVDKMEKFLQECENYLAVYSSSFQRSPYCKQEFQAAFNAHINGKIKKFLPVRVEDTALEELYSTTVYIDLFNIRDEKQAERELLDAVSPAPHSRRPQPFPNARRAPKESARAAQKPPRYPGPAAPAAAARGTVRSIISLGGDAGKSSEMLDRLVQEVLHGLGFDEAGRLYRSKDIRVSRHRAEKRCALVKFAPGRRKVGPEELNAFAGTLDVEGGKYIQEGIGCTGYYIARGGFTAAALKQEAERAGVHDARRDSAELILLGPCEIAQELIRAQMLCAPPTAADAVSLAGKPPLYLHDGADLLLSRYGRVWVLYYSRQPKKRATHFALVHADGHQLADAVAKELLAAARGTKTPFSGLVYLPAARDASPDIEKARELYFRYLENELGEVQFEGMPTDKEAGAVRVDLESIFVPLLYREETDRPGGSHEESRRDLRSIRGVLMRSPRAAILARPGGGKSMLIRRMALAYAVPERRMLVDDGLPKKDWLPVYIRCRDLGENATKSIQEIIGTIVYRAEIRAYAAAFDTLVENRLQGGRILLLIDGLDEIALERDRICFVNQLRTFAATYPSVHLIVTSRETGFRAVAGTLASYCTQYTISTLESDQIRSLSLKWHQALLGKTEQAQQDSDKVCDVILGDLRILTLAENPLLLTTLLFVKRWVGYLPTKKCRLYEEMIKLLLVTWNAAAHDRLDMDETEPQLAFVAFSMTCGRQQKVARSQLKEYIIAARQAMPEILGYMRMSPAQFIDQVEERSSLLIQLGLEENAAGQLEPSYEFSHLSFQEYLTARAIAQGWNPDPGRYGLLDVVKQHLQEEQWLEVVPLAAVLSGRQAGPVIQYLIDESKADNGGSDPIRTGRERGDTAALLLGNCIAGEVPMSELVLKEALIQVTAHRQNLEDREMFGLGTVSTLNMFHTILKSKYGDIYRTLVRTRVFENRELDGITAFCNAWIDIYTGGSAVDPNEIVQLLGPGRPREDKATGALLMMEWTYLLDVMREHPEKTAADEQDEAFFQTVFGAILELLRTDDALLQFAAVWCIAWSGYNERNIIPPELYQSIMDSLLALWSGTRMPPLLKYMLSWAVFSVTCPLVTVQKSDALITALDKNLTQPATEFDSIAAASLSVLTGRWDKEQFRKWWDGADIEHVQLHMSDERYLHGIHYLTDDLIEDKDVDAGPLVFE